MTIPMAMGARDAGWIQLFAENNQEAYDNYIQCMPISENPDVRLPIMACQDGFITSHAVENIELETDEMVQNFVGTYNPETTCSSMRIRWLSARMAFLRTTWRQRSHRQTP